MMLTCTRTRPVPKIATRPDPTRPAGIPVPVGLPLLGIIGLVAYPRSGQLIYIALVLMNLFSVVENMSCMHHQSS